MKLPAAAFFFVVGLAGSTVYSTAGSSGEVRTGSGAEKLRPAVGLKQIYDEVKDLGPYPGESFIKHEFFLGPADDDTYKKEHVVVLIQSVDGGERLRIQVTEMQSRPDNPRVQLAGRVRTIVCSIAGGELTLERADYSEREIEVLAPDILRAVREKKKLLKLLGPATCAWSFFGHNRGAASAAIVTL